jgi:hypothetical protein
VVILRISATNGNMSFRREELWLDGCLAFETRMPRPLELWTCVSVIDGGLRGRALYFNHNLAFVLQLMNITAKPQAV